MASSFRHGFNDGTLQDPGLDHWWAKGAEFAIRRGRLSAYRPLIGFWSR